MKAVAPLFLTFMLFVAPFAVRGQDIPKLESSVTDQTGTIEPRRAEIEAALETLFNETGVQLYVLFVPTTGSRSVGDFATRVGEESLGPDDALLLVAVKDRTDNISIGSDLRDRVSQTSLDRVRTDVLEPGLARGDFPTAVVSSAQALADVFQPIPSQGAQTEEEMEVEARLASLKSQG
ncbi:MAG: TPM domain-containing protein [Candidatus Limnocylindrales bacterium]